MLYRFVRSDGKIERLQFVTDKEACEYGEMIVDRDNLSHCDMFVGDDMAYIGTAMPSLPTFRSYR